MREFFKKYPGLYVFIEIGIIIILVFFAYLFAYHRRNAKQQDFYDKLKDEAWVAAAATPQIENEIKETETEEAEEIKEIDENLLRKPDFEKYWEINPDVIGYVYMPDSVIDYPILKKADSDNYYLKHTIDNKSGYPGCICVESFVSSNLDDKTTILYGHNMSNGTMFGSLHKIYRDHEYLESHKIVYVYTPESVEKYELVCISHYSDEHLFVDDYEKNADGTYSFAGFKGDENVKVIEKIKAYNDKTAYFSDITVGADDKVLVLSTCNTDWTRVIAVYKEIESK